MLSRNGFIILVSRNLRHFSGKNASSAWEIKPRQWRTDVVKQPDEDSLAYRFGPSIATVNTIHKFDPAVYPIKKRISVKKIVDEEEETLSEILKEEKTTRGGSLAVAQFLVFNGASVRFSGYPDWIGPQDGTIGTMPNVSETANYLEAIDLSELPITYATLRGIRSLHKVTSLRVYDCPKFNNWCLDHLTGNLLGLEKVDISNCPLLTAAGLGTLSKLRNLREVKLHGLQTDTEMELMCILLEEYFKDLKIEGVSYSVDKIQDVPFSVDKAE